MTDGNTNQHTDLRAVQLLCSTRAQLPTQVKLFSANANLAVYWHVRCSVRSRESAGNVASIGCSCCVRVQYKVLARARLLRQPRSGSLSLLTIVQLHTSEPVKCTRCSKLPKVATSLVSQKASQTITCFSLVQQLVQCISACRSNLIGGR